MVLHLRLGAAFKSPCGVWLDAVETTRDRRLVTCERCLQRTQPVDHPHTDPGDGRSECDVCGKWIFPMTHSCKGVPGTEAALRRRAERTDR